MCAYNSKNASADTLSGESAGAVGALGLGKSLSVSGASHVEGLCCHSEVSLIHMCCCTL